MCSPSTLFKLNEKVKQKIKTIDILEGSTTIGEKTFDSMPKLRKINLPKSLQKMDVGCIFDCPNVKKFKLPHKFMNSIQKLQIVHLEITECTTNMIKNTDFAVYVQLESLVLPECVTELPEKIHEICPKLCEITCSTKLIPNLPEPFKCRLKKVHFPYEEVDKNEILKDIPGIEEIKVKEGTDTVKLKQNLNKTIQSFNLINPARLLSVLSL